ncbi:glycosyltransferase [Crossiella sp. SN42]|uniref:glycosyltransferase n=1 Tax=Crossiella sp. SN42 TaxID=2944808 RepID=UPI00207CBB3D|nr:glycosyltransferase [Crossiella sp. SN42]MCO1581436.1 glycosyltransferase [Crossiella sp. SN42]
MSGDNDELWRGLLAPLRPAAGARMVRVGPEGLAGGGPFDLALLDGTVEHTADPAELLAQVTGQLAEDGVLVLAVHNQLGLGQLLGKADPVRQRLWLGAADYPGVRGPRTWTRSVLAELLDGAGLTAQRWLACYPDQARPRVLVDSSVFERDDQAELVDKLVRDPLLGAADEQLAAAPGRRLHQLALAEGFAGAVAPAFLVVAGRRPEAVAELVQPGLAWLVNSSRHARWQRTRRLTEDLVLETIEGTEDAEGWLRQRVAATEPWLPGRCLDAELLDALAEGDVNRAGVVLGLWCRVCLTPARALTAEDQRHPFLPGRAGVPVLPPDCLDVHPGNVVLGPDREARRIDLEWEAGSGVDAELALLRGLREFARELRDSGAPHPWPAETNLQKLLFRLADLCGLGGPARQRWTELTSAEVALQQLVSGAPREQVLATLEADAVLPGRPRVWELPPGLGEVGRALAAKEQAEKTARSLWTDVEALRQQIAHRQAELTQARAQAEELRDELSREHQAAEAALRTADAEREALRQELARTQDELVELDNRVGSAFAGLAEATEDFERIRAEADTARAEAAGHASAGAQLRDRLARTRARLDALEGSSLVRAGHRYVWPAARAARGVRDLLLGRGGAEPDSVLRRASRYAPALAPLLARRLRVREGGAREAGLRFVVDVPTEPVHIGRGQVVDLAGWAVHADLPVRAVWIKADGRMCPANLGYHRPVVRRELGAAGWHVPDGSGFRARVPLPAGPTRHDLPLELIVDLADGTRLHRALPALRTRAEVGIRPVRVDWPGTGPRVAICLASYHPDRRFLAEQLDSIRAQTHDNWVCVISDDGTDPAARSVLGELTEGDPRFVVVEHERNVGFYRNFERALRLAPLDADAIALSDQDDVWDADKLAVQLARLADPKVQLVYCDMRLIDDYGKLIAKTSWDKRRNQWTELDALLMLNTVTGAASLVRADLVRERVLPFPPGTPTAYHDQWIAATALSVGELSFVDRPLQSYRQHGENVTGWMLPWWTSGLPGPVGLAELSLGNERRLTPQRREELEHVVEHELRRIAQFASVLLARNEDRLAPADRAELVKLAGVERQLSVLVELAARNGKRPETGGTERYFLTAALRWHALRRARRRMPERTVPPLD